MGNQTLPAVNAISVRIFEGEVIHAPSRLSRFVVGYAGGGLPERNPDPHARIDVLDVAPTWTQTTATVWLTPGRRYGILAASRPQRVAGHAISGPPGASVQSSAELMRFATMGDMGNARLNLYKRTKPGRRRRESRWQIGNRSFPCFPTCSHSKLRARLFVGLETNDHLSHIVVTSRRISSSAS